MSRLVPVVLLCLLLVGVVSAQEGFFVLSSGRADFLSNDPQVGGSAWLVTVSQNGAGMSAVGTFSPDQMIDVANGYRAQYPLTIRSRTESQTVSWRIVKGTQAISDVNKQNVNIQAGWDLLTPWSYWDNRGKECIAAHPNEQPMFFKRAWETYGVCVWFNNNRPVAQASPDSEKNFRVRLSATANNREVVGYLTNDQQTSVNLGNEVFATWVGSAVSGFDVSFPADTSFVWLPNTGRWQTVSRAAVTNYGLARDNLATCLASQSALSYDDCIVIHRTATSRALAGTSVVIPDALSAQAVGSQSDGRFVVSLSRPIQFPLITMKIRASWVGFVQLVGVPKILSLGSENVLRTGDTLVEQVSVRNVGEFRGSFDVFASCSSPLSSSARQRVTLDAGQSQTVFLPITGSCSAQQAASCTFTMVDVSNPSRSSTMSKSYSCRTVVVCTPDAFRCNGNVIEKCAADGSRYVPTQTCAGACQMDAGVASCSGQCLAGAEVCLDGVLQVCRPDQSGFSPKVPAQVCAGEECKDELFGLIKAQVGQTELCNFWCKVGLSKPKPVTVCVKDYTPLIIVLATVFLIVALTIFKKVGGKKRGGKGGVAEWLVGEGGLLRSKVFWVVIAAIVGFALIVGYFAFFFWTLVVLLLLALVYVIVRIVVFKRIW